MNRPALSLAQFGVFVSQLVVRHAPSIGVLQHRNEALPVVCLPGIEAEHLLVKVAV